MKKIKILLLFLMAFMLLPSFSQAKELKIGYADLQVALNECDAGIKNTKALQNERTKFEKEISATQEELKKIRDEIEKKRNVWNEETLKAKQLEFNKKVMGYEQYFNDNGQRLLDKQQQIETELIKELRAIVKDIAKKKGYTFIFEVSIGGVLYAPEDADITEALIKAHNKKFAKGRK